jgi:hypothetical protein
MLKNRKHNKSVSLWEMGKVESIEEFYKEYLNFVSTYFLFVISCCSSCLTLFHHLKFKNE